MNLEFQEIAVLVARRKFKGTCVKVEVMGFSVW